MKVEDFGAVGDGVTDDTEAFNLTAKESEYTDGCIETRIGHIYGINRTLYIPKRVNLELAEGVSLIGQDVIITNINRFSRTVTGVSFNNFTKFIGTVTDVSEDEHGLEITGWLDDTWLDEVYTQKERKQICKEIGHFWRKNNRSSHRKSQICIRCGKKKRNP